jgi:hypothetical protein
MHDDNNNPDSVIDEKGNKVFKGSFNERIKRSESEGSYMTNLKVGDVLRIGDTAILLTRIRKNHDARVCVVADKSIKIQKVDDRK